MGSHAYPRRISTAAEDRRVIFDSIRRIVRALRVSSRAAEKSAGLSGAQLFVLQTLAEGGRALSLNELAERTLTHQSSVSVVVSRLARRRLITVSRSAADGRRLELALTRAGAKALVNVSTTPQDRPIHSLSRMSAVRCRRLARTLNDLVCQAGLGDAAPTLFQI